MFFLKMVVKTHILEVASHCAATYGITNRISLEVILFGDIRALTLGTLCFKFLCVIGLKDRHFNF